MRFKSAVAALALAAVATFGAVAPADAAPKAKAKSVKVVKKAPVRKADPCSPAAVAKVPGVKPFKSEGLTFVRTDVLPSTNTSPVPNRWVNYRGPQVWLSTAVCGTTYRQVFVWADGKARPYI